MPYHVSHIYDYYNFLWRNHKCIAWNLLRIGYRQSCTDTVGIYNNLFEIDHV